MIESTCSVFNGLVLLSFCIQYCVCVLGPRKYLITDITDISCLRNRESSILVDFTNHLRVDFILRMRILSSMGPDF